tara:strand:+ start:6690 stop:7745 length:1056 start_codon:yes stop_codon:yes gene_type:complete
MSYIDKIFSNRKKILVTGGAGFIGSALIRKLLKYSSLIILNIDKLSYASDLFSINKLLDDKNIAKRYKFLKIDLYNFKEIRKALFDFEPDLVFHLAAESHVDKSILDPSIFIKSNIVGTFNLLQSSLEFYETLSDIKKKFFRFHHISTDEVFGSIEDDKLFHEKSSYDPRSPYSASKASSDHLVRAWSHTYDLPVILTNCSNNFGPWQFPEKLIPKAITNALRGTKIPLYGDGLNVRDWLYVDDHVEALLLSANKGTIGESYCIGNNNEKTNKEVLFEICNILDELKPAKGSYFNLIKEVKDRPGHDRRYAINPQKIQNQLNWIPKYNFRHGLEKTIKWYIDNHSWWESKK